MHYIFPPPPVVCLPVLNDARFFPVRRIFCVGRNYPAHAHEMGASDQAAGREPPFFFAKPRDAVVGGAGEIEVHYPPATASLHHEVELIVALRSGGQSLTVAEAEAAIFGYAVGLDLTRRDLQARAKERGHPWDMGKGFDQSAVAGAICPVGACGHPRAGRIWLQVNGQLRQSGDLADMLWTVPEIMARLSSLVRLSAGDLIYTGTPAGVGAIEPGDWLEGRVDGIGTVLARIRKSSCELSKG